MKERINQGFLLVAQAHFESFNLETVSSSYRLQTELLLKPNPDKNLCCVMTNQYYWITGCNAKKSKTFFSLLSLQILRHFLLHANILFFTVITMSSSYRQLSKKSVNDMCVFFIVMNMNTFLSGNIFSLENYFVL